MRILGIDYGTRHVGLALSDETLTIASPLETVPNTSGLKSRISEIITAHDVTRVIMGESRNADGAENPVMKEARTFARALETEAGIAVIYEPEYYTTQQARREHHTREQTNAAAAALILQSYLDKQDHD